MNKLFTKIGVAFVGMAMAIGVGASVGGNKKVLPASAGIETHSVTINYSSTDSITGTNYSNSYVDHRFSASFEGTPVYFGGILSNSNGEGAIGLRGKNNGEYFGNLNPASDSAKTWASNIPDGSVGAIPYPITGIDVTMKNATGASRGIDVKVGTSIVYDATKKVPGGTDYSSSSYAGASYDSTNRIFSISYNASDNYRWLAIGPATGNSYVGVSSIKIYYQVTISDDPYVNMDKTSISGYTLQEKSLTASFGNLVGSGVTWTQTSEDDGEVVIGTPDTSVANKSTVTITLKTAGTVVVKATDNGGTAFGSCTFTISASNITISLDKDSVSVQTTRKVQVTATVTAVGAYSSDVTWSSDDESVATVDETGLITGKTVGTTTVRCTSDDFPTETKSVSVTVTARVYERFISITKDNLRSIDTSQAANSYARYNGTAEQGDYGLETSNVCLNSSKLQFKRGAGYMNNTTAFAYGIHLVKVTTFGSSNADYTVKFANSADGIASSGTEGTKVVVGNNHYWIPKSSATFFYVVDTTTATSNQLKVDAIDVYEETNAALTFSSDFVTAMATPCADENANNLTGVSAIWSTYKAGFEALTSESKSEFGSSTNETIVQAKTLYLHIVDRYKLSTWTGAPAGTHFNFSTVENNGSSTTIIVIISLMSFVALGGFFMLKKKKEQ